MYANKANDESKENSKEHFAVVQQIRALAYRTTQTAVASEQFIRTLTMSIPKDESVGR